MCERKIHCNVVVVWLGELLLTKQHHLKTVEFCGVVVLTVLVFIFILLKKQNNHNQAMYWPKLEERRQYST